MLLLSGAAIVSLLGAGYLSAGVPKTVICHFTPGNPQKITIGGPAADDHKDHHDDWISNADGDCYADVGVPDHADSFAVLVCIDRPGKRMGREITTSLAGLISSRKMGCDL